MSVPGTHNPSSINYHSIYNQIDERVRQFPFIVNLSQSIGIQPAILVIAVSTFGFVALVFGWAGALICNVVGFMYPAWMSFKAVESPDKDDDRLWLTYWIVYAAFTIAECFVDLILCWVPFYYLLKLAFLMYMCLPWFRGAEVLYIRLIRPLLLKHQPYIEGAVEGIGAVGTAAAEGVSSFVNDGIDILQNATHVIQRNNNNFSNSRNDPAMYRE